MSPMRLAPLAFAALLLATAAQAQSSPPAEPDPNGPDSNGPDSNGEVKTLKERLSDKASDEQRVDNCRVPPDQRGTTPRPG
ncbi:MAG: hypothetical protein JO255_06685, partial [Alphaproteobacteria bacterium]|nr:hypothetical protein [Alphaproteobacteria bacterium]